MRHAGVVNTIFLFLFCLLPVAGQTQPLQVPEWPKDWTRTQILAFRAGYRDKLTIETAKSPEWPWAFYSEQTTEHDASKNRHNIQLSGSRREMIEIGNVIYERLPGRDWVKRERTVAKPIMFWEVLPSQVEYRVGKEKIEPSGTSTENNDVRETFLEKISHDSVRLKDGTIISGTTTDRRWFDTHGRLVKSVITSYNFERKNYTRRTTLYEYDPTIVITAPIP